MSSENLNALPISHYLDSNYPIVYGCMGLGGSGNAKADVALASTAIEAALAAGIEVFDHDDIYARGNAEATFGQALKASPELREKMLLQSKCAIRFGDDKTVTRYDFSKEWIEHSIDGSLTRLGVDYLDVYLLHRPDPLMEPEVLAETLQKLHDTGKVKHFGVSNMDHWQMQFIQKHLQLPLITNQIELSLNQLDWLDQGVLVGNPIGKDLNYTPGTIEYCTENKIQIQAWGSLSQGLFTGGNVLSNDPRIEKTKALVTSLGEQYEVSPEAIVLAWLMRHPAKIQPIIGTTNVQRIDHCCQATSVTLSREDWYALYVSARGEILP